MSKALKDIAKRAETWPEEAQKELVRAAREIEEEYVNSEHLSAEERKARQRQRAWKGIKEVTSQVKDLQPNPNEDNTAKEEDIAEMVKEYRRSKHA